MNDNVYCYVVHAKYFMHSYKTGNRNGLVGTIFFTSPFVDIKIIEPQKTVESFTDTYYSSEYTCTSDFAAWVSDYVWMGEREWVNEREVQRYYDEWYVNYDCVSRAFCKGFFFKVSWIKVQSAFSALNCTAVDIVL